MASSHPPTATFHATGALAVELAPVLGTARRDLDQCLPEGGNPLRATTERPHHLELLGQLTRTVAHDFNNLLSVILANLEGLRDRSTDPDVQKATKAALEATLRGGKLVQSLLAFAKHQSVCHGVFDVNAMIREMTAMLHQSLGSRVSLEMVLADDLWPVATDVTQAEMAVLNLAVNARDAMPDGGVVRIETANVILTGEREGLRGVFVALTVADSGCGMPPEVLARAFEPFFTTKPEGKGTGLGLSMVCGFAKQSGGTVAISSQPGKGTAATIYLPRSPSAASSAGAAEP